MFVQQGAASASPNMQPNFTFKTDEALVKELLETGNHSCFEQLYQRHVRQVYYQCFTYVKDEMIAQDLCQEVFIKVYDKLSQFQYKSSFTTWLYRVSRNVCLDYLRKHQKEMFEKDPAEGLQEPEAEVPAVADSELMELKSDQLQHIMDQLKIEEREILMMKYAYDWPIEEIAAVMDLSIPAVKMRLKRAKAKVKKRYEEQFSAKK
ncbi:MAG: RNA polymerase sigma factor [Bacteroidetes bacterium]|nr:MAG: RNA polymerase sigma factor [Bacteroidota bacterium]